MQLLIFLLALLPFLGGCDILGELLQTDARPTLIVDVSVSQPFAPVGEKVAFSASVTQQCLPTDDASCDVAKSSRPVVTTLLDGEPVELPGNGLLLLSFSEPGLHTLRVDACYSHKNKPPRCAGDVATVEIVPVGNRDPLCETCKGETPHLSAEIFAAPQIGLNDVALLNVLVYVKEEVKSLDMLYITVQVSNKLLRLPYEIQLPPMPNVTPGLKRFTFELYPVGSGVEVISVEIKSSTKSKSYELNELNTQVEILPPTPSNDPVG